MTQIVNVIKNKEMNSKFYVSIEAAIIKALELL